MERSIANAGGDSEAYRKAKAKKDASLAKAVRNTGSRAKTLGQRGGIYKKGKPLANNPNNPHYNPDDEKTKGKGYGKEADTSQKMSRKQIDRSGVRGHPGETASKIKDAIRKRKLR